jgi:hypothetical protein
MGKVSQVFQVGHMGQVVQVGQVGRVSQFSQQGGAGLLGQVESGSKGSERSPVQQVSHMGVSDGSDKSHWTSLVNSVGGHVLDLGSRDRDVVLVRRTIDLGCWEFGMGREWGG